MCFKVNRVFGAEFGVTGLAAGRGGRIPRWSAPEPARRRRAEPQGLVWAGEELSEVLKAPGSRPAAAPPAGPPGR